MSLSLYDVVFHFTTRGRHNTIHHRLWPTALGRIILHSELSFNKYHLHCVRNSITTVTLTDKQTNTVFPSTFSESKPLWQVKGMRGALCCRIITQEFTQERNWHLYSQKHPVHLATLSGFVTHTHQWSLTEVKAMHYSHLICIKKLTKHNIKK